jgi:hypothetical protein
MYDNAMISRSELFEGQQHPAESTALRWNLAAVTIALLTGLGAALLPMGTSSSIDSNGVETSTRVSLLSNEGPSVLIVVAIPALLVGVPLLLRGAKARHRSRIIIVTLLGIFVLLAAMTIGLFFLPTLIAMAMSLSTERTRGGYASSSRPSSTR